MIYLWFTTSNTYQEDLVPWFTFFLTSFLFLVMHGLCCLCPVLSSYHSLNVSHLQGLWTKPPLNVQENGEMGLFLTSETPVGLPLHLQMIFFLMHKWLS